MPPKLPSPGLQPSVKTTGTPSSAPPSTAAAAGKKSKTAAPAPTAPAPTASAPPPSASSTATTPPVTVSVDNLGLPLMNKHKSSIREKNSKVTEAQKKVDEAQDKVIDDIINNNYKKTLILSSTFSVIDDIQQNVTTDINDTLIKQSIKIAKDKMQNIDEIIKKRKETEEENETDKNQIREFIKPIFEQVKDGKLDNVKEDDVKNNILEKITNKIIQVSVANNDFNVNEVFSQAIKNVVDKASAAPAPAGAAAPAAAPAAAAVGRRATSARRAAPVGIAGVAAGVAAPVGVAAPAALTTAKIKEIITPAVNAVNTSTAPAAGAPANVDIIVTAVAGANVNNKHFNTPGTHPINAAIATIASIIAAKPTITNLDDAKAIAKAAAIAVTKKNDDVNRLVDDAIVIHNPPNVDIVNIIAVAAVTAAKTVTSPAPPAPIDINAAATNLINTIATAAAAAAAAIPVADPVAVLATAVANPVAAVPPNGLAAAAAVLAAAAAPAAPNDDAVINAIDVIARAAISAISGGPIVVAPINAESIKAAREIFGEVRDIAATVRTNINIPEIIGTFANIGTNNPNPAIAGTYAAIIATKTNQSINEVFNAVIKVTNQQQNIGDIIDRVASAIECITSAANFNIDYDKIPDENKKKYELIKHIAKKTVGIIDEKLPDKDNVLKLTKSIYAAILIIGHVITDKYEDLKNNMNKGKIISEQLKYIVTDKNLLDDYKKELQAKEDAEEKDKQESTANMQKQKAKDAETETKVKARTEELKLSVKEFKLPENIIENNASFDGLIENIARLLVYVSQ